MVFTTSLQKPIAALTRSCNEVIDTGQLEVTNVIINNLGRDVIIGFRSGMSMTLFHRRHRSLPPGLYIETTMSANLNYVKTDSKDILNDDSAGDILKGFAKSEMISPGKATFRSVVRVELEDIVKRDGLLYLIDTDYQLSILDAKSTPHHPYYAGQLQHELIEFNPSMTTGMFGYEIAIVDNESHFGDRYINVHGQVYRVKAMVRSERVSGLYITSSGDHTSGSQHSKPKTQYIPFSEIDSHAINQFLFKTIEEAQTHGSPIETLQREHDAVVLSLKKDVAIAKHALEQQSQELKVKEMERKDYYSVRESVRSDSSAMLKTLPVIVAAVAAGIALFRR